MVGLRDLTASPLHAAAGSPGFISSTITPTRPSFAFTLVTAPVTVFSSYGETMSKPVWGEP